MGVDSRKVRLNYFPRELALSVSYAKKPASYVYFISDGEFVKIGKGVDVFSRLKILQCGNPRKLEFLFAIPAKSESDSFDIEHALHLSFQEYRLNGEWFDILPMLDRKNFEKQFGIRTVLIEDELQEGTLEKENSQKQCNHLDENFSAKNDVQFMTIKQLAKTGILPEFRIRQLVATNQIPFFKSGNRVYINYKSVVDFLKSFC